MTSISSIRLSVNMICKLYHKNKGGRFHSISGCIECPGLLFHSQGSSVGTIAQGLVFLTLFETRLNRDIDGVLIIPLPQQWTEFLPHSFFARLTLMLEYQVWKPSDRQTSVKFLASPRISGSCSSNISSITFSHLSLQNNAWERPRVMGNSYN